MSQKNGLFHWLPSIFVPRCIQVHVRISVFLTFTWVKGMKGDAKPGRLTGCCGP